MHLSIGITAGFMVLAAAGLGAALLLTTQHNPRLLLPIIALLILAASIGAFVFGYRLEWAMRRLRWDIAENEGYKLFVANAPQGFFRMEDNGRFLEINAALAHICGYETVEQFSQNVNADPGLLYADPQAHAELAMQMHMKGVVADFVIKMRRRDGKVIWTVQHARAIYDADGRFRFFEGTVQDVNLQHESLEAAQRALQQAKQAARAKSAFLSAMSHELKTPLNAIIGFSELMQRELFGPIQERYLSYLGDIHMNGRALLALIVDVLDYTRAEGGALELRESEFALDQVIDAGLDAAVENRPERPEISVKVTPGLPLMRGDERRVSQILKNILSNAIKFTPQTGRVEVRASLGVDNSILLQVTDTGMGMEPERIAMALEPLKQIESKLSRRFEGIGLGLPLAQALIRLHGGEMSIVSALGRGTTVHIAFPPGRTVGTAAPVAHSEGLRRIQ